MVFDVVKARAQALFRDAKYACEFVLQIAHFRGITDTVFDLSRLCDDASSSKQDLLVQVCRRVAGDTDVVKVGERDTSRLQTVSDGLRRKTGGVFEAIETLFFNSGDQSTIFSDGRRSISVISIYTEYIH